MPGVFPIPGSTIVARGSRPSQPLDIANRPCGGSTGRARGALVEGPRAEHPRTRNRCSPGCAGRVKALDTRCSTIGRVIHDVYADLFDDDLDAVSGALDQARSAAIRCHSVVTGRPLCLAPMVELPRDSGGTAAEN
jgi:hypothetical protein